VGARERRVCFDQKFSRAAKLSQRREDSALSDIVEFPAKRNHKSHVPGPRWASSSVLVKQCKNAAKACWTPSAAPAYPCNLAQAIAAMNDDRHIGLIAANFHLLAKDALLHIARAE